MFIIRVRGHLLVFAPGADPGADHDRLTPAQVDRGIPQQVESFRER
jgi:hypothetical protein